MYVYVYIMYIITISQNKEKHFHLPENLQNTLISSETLKTMGLPALLEMHIDVILQVIVNINSTK